MISSYASTNVMREIHCHKGRISKEWIINVLKQERHEETANTFSIAPRRRIKDGIVNIIGFTVHVRYMGIARDAALDFYDIEYMKKKYKWFLKHEMGHFIDNILHYDGLTIEEVEKIDDKITADYDKYYKWLDEYKKKPGFSADTTNRVYYDIPGEAIANELMDINVDEMINLDNAFRKKYGDKVVKTSIKIEKIRKYTKEEDAYFNGDTETKEEEKGKPKES